MKLITMLIALAAALAPVTSANAQQECEGGQGLMTETTIVVTPSGSCSCTIDVPWGAPYAPYYPGRISCCNTIQTSFVYAPQLCPEWSSNARNSNLVLAALHAETVTGEQFLTADCEGNLVPFRPPPQPSFAAKVPPIVWN